MEDKIETYKATMWKITFTNALGRKYKMRFHYANVIFDTKEAADRECDLLIKHHDPERSTNEDYQVEEFISNLLAKPISFE